MNAKPPMRKRLEFDAETWHALHFLGRDTMKSLQELATRPFVICCANTVGPCLLGKLCGKAPGGIPQTMTAFQTAIKRRARSDRRMVVSELRTVAVELVEEAQSFVQEIDDFDSPPSRAQIDRVQESLTQLQRRLNRIQTETDTWSEEKEAV